MLKLIFFYLTLSQSKIISPNQDGEYNIRHHHNKNEISWIALGDWGGQSVETIEPFHLLHEMPWQVYLTPKDGFDNSIYTRPSKIQIMVAESMKRTSKMYKPEYILALGDNFYRFGVRSIEDPAWEDVFENVYDSDELMCPWYPVTGNHDWGNNEDCGDAGNWTAQILYSKKSERWTFPDLCYTVDSILENGTKQRIIMIDTTLLSGVYGAEKPDDPNGKPEDREYSEAMWKWVEKTLKSSDEFDFLFVAGHYMLLDSIGYYDAVLVSRLLPLLKRYKVSAYIQGHRHSLEHVQEFNFESINDVHFFVSGCGAQLEESTYWEFTWDEQNYRTHDIAGTVKDEEVYIHYHWTSKRMNGGYMYFTTTAEHVKVEIIEAKNDSVLYETFIPPRKN